MIGLDTNVLLRILVDDGSPQVATARRFAVEQTSAGHTLYVDQIVLVEAVWVLESVFAYGKAQVVAALDALLNNASYVVERRDTAAAAWTKFRDGRADYSDCLIAANHAAAGCAFTATFDRAMRELPTTRIL